MQGLKGEVLEWYYNTVQTRIDEKEVGRYIKKVSTNKGLVGCLLFTCLPILELVSRDKGLLAKQRKKFSLQGGPDQRALKVET